MDNEVEYFVLNQLNTSPLIIENILNDSKSKNSHRYVFNTIKSTIDQFIEGNHASRFLILPGIRGTGKTTLIYQAYDYIINSKNINSERVLFIDAEKLMAKLSLNLENTLDYFIKYYHEGYPVLDEPLFILIDEAHYDKNWEKTLKLIFNYYPQVFILCTGSSALELEISPDSARRSDKFPVNPLSFREYLNLKHGIDISGKDGNNISSLLFSYPNENNIFKAYNSEKKINKDLFSLKKPADKEWKYYLKYGGFPYEFNIEKELVTLRTIELINKVIKYDVDPIYSTTYSSKLTANFLIQLLASQKPGETSQNKLRQTIQEGSGEKVANGTLNQLLDTFEKTKLIFHVEPYASPFKAVKKPWKYYFAHPCLKYALWLGSRIASQDSNQLCGILAENLAAFQIHSLIYNGLVECYYDPLKGGVDFLLSSVNGLVPIEVGIGKKSLKQVKTAMNNYNSQFGVLISNRTDYITVEEDITCIPVRTFSLI